MADETLFSRIAEKKIPAQIVYEDDLCIAFRDVNPQAPVHVLLVPRKIIPKLSDASPVDSSLLGHLLSVVPRVATLAGAESDFRVVINNGESSGQTVFHLHLHILGGRKMAWPPG